MKSRWARLEGIAWGALLVATCGLFAWYCHGLPLALAEESRASLAWARTIAEIGSPRLTWGGAVEEGFPSAAWLALQVLLLEAGLDATRWLRVVTCVSGAALVLVTGLFGPVVFRRAPRLEDAMPAVALALNAFVARAAVDGTETSLWSFAVLVVAMVVTRSFARARPRLAGVAVALLALVRPEAVLLVPPTFAAWWLAARLARGEQPRRPTIEALTLVTASLFVLALAWGARFLVFADFWPTMPPSSRPDAATFAAQHANWVWTAVAGLLVTVVWRRFVPGGTGLAALWAAALLLGALLPGAAPIAAAAVPLLAVVAGAGVSSARDALRLPGGPARGLVWASLCGVGVTLASTTMMKRATVNAPEPAPSVAPLASGLRAHGVERPFVATDRPLEVAADLRSARLLAVRKADLEHPRVLDDRLTSEGPPDIAIGEWLGALPMAQAVLVAPDDELDGGAWVLGNQSQDEDPRCPDGKLSLVGLTPELLIEQLERDLGSGQPARALQRWVCAAAYLPDDQLPSALAREPIVAQALAHARELEAQGQLEAAVRHLSLATLLEDEDPHLRRRTERLRARWLSPAE